MPRKKVEAKAEEEKDWRSQPRRDKKMRDRHLSLRVTEDDEAAIEEMAEEMMRPKADVVIMAIREYYKMRKAVMTAKSFGFKTE